MKKPNQIEELARIVAELKYPVPYDDLQFHQKLSCEVQVEFIVRVIKTWRKRKNERIS